jgi:hypothetical protein
MAEGRGFEPPDGCNPSTVFETAAFSRSATLPFVILYPTTGFRFVSIYSLKNPVNDLLSAYNRVTRVKNQQLPLCLNTGLNFLTSFGKKSNGCFPDIHKV